MVIFEALVFYMTRVFQVLNVCLKNRPYNVTIRNLNALLLD